mgnify:CR=1 FL=1
MFLIWAALLFRRRGWLPLPSSRHWNISNHKFMIVLFMQFGALDMRTKSGRIMGNVIQCSIRSPIIIPLLLNWRSGHRCRISTLIILVVRTWTISSKRKLMETIVWVQTGKIKNQVLALRSLVPDRSPLLGLALLPRTTVLYRYSGKFGTQSAKGVLP